MKGEVIFTAGGQRYTLFLGNAAQCALEEQHDKGFFAIVADALPNVTPAALEDPVALAEMARGVRVSALRELFWHALRKHHPALTIEEVSDIADELGQAKFGELLGKAIAGAQDMATKGAGGAGKGNRGTRGSARTG